MDDDLFLSIKTPVPKISEIFGKKGEINHNFTNFMRNFRTLHPMTRFFNIDQKLRRLRNRYRLVIINDDSFEEVVAFKLTRMSVYIAASSLFVLLVGITVALISFTNLKYYLPGYGTQSQRKALVQYKVKIDSLELASRQKDIYLEELKKVLSGDVRTQSRDTSTLEIPETELETQ